MYVVVPVQRIKVPAAENVLRIPQATIIDLEFGEALEQRRQAYREENHPSREINQIPIGRALNRNISENEISDTEIIVLDSESETGQISE